jgi:hypothetical protein
MFGQCFESPMPVWYASSAENDHGNTRASLKINRPQQLEYEVALDFTVFETVSARSQD